MPFLFSRRRSHEVVLRNSSSAFIAEQEEAFERVSRVRVVFTGLLTLFPDGLNSRVFDGVERRAWLHHISETELGGGISSAGARTYFGWTRQNQLETLSVQANDSGNLLYELDPEQHKVRIIEGTSMAPAYGEKGKRGIEHLEKLAEAFGELALKGA